MAETLLESMAMGAVVPSRVAAPAGVAAAARTGTVTSVALRVDMALPSLQAHGRQLGPRDITNAACISMGTALLQEHTPHPSLYLAALGVCTGHP